MEVTVKEQVQRVQYVVDQQFQRRLAIDLTIIVLAMLVIFSIGLGIVVGYAVALDPLLANKPFTFGLLGQQLKQLWWLMAVLAVGCLALSTGIIYYYTHRIAGPVYRLRRVFDDLSNGVIHTQLQLRQGDCFENLAGSVLRANATLASSIGELKSIVSTSPKKGKVAEGGKNQIARIRHVLDRFQVVQEKNQKA